MHAWKDFIFVHIEVVIIARNRFASASKNLVEPFLKWCCMSGYDRTDLVFPSSFVNFHVFLFRHDPIIFEHRLPALENKYMFFDAELITISVEKNQIEFSQDGNESAVFASNLMWRHEASNLNLICVKAYGLVFVLFTFKVVNQLLTKKWVIVAWKDNP